MALKPGTFPTATLHAGRERLRSPVIQAMRVFTYPGVHVLYHRWQVQGRRETPAPYWIANIVDGNGASYYTFGDRHRAELDSYYDQALAAFSSIARISDANTIIVQMIAFSEPSWQLPRYLETMCPASVGNGESVRPLR